MIEVHLVGYTSDLRHLVLDLDPDNGAGRYRLVVDADLFLTIDEIRDLRREKGMDVGIPYPTAANGDTSSADPVLESEPLAPGTASGPATDTASEPERPDSRATAQPDDGEDTGWVEDAERVEQETDGTRGRDETDDTNEVSETNETGGVEDAVEGRTTDADDRDGEPAISAGFLSHLIDDDPNEKALEDPADRDMLVVDGTDSPSDGARPDGDEAVAGANTGPAPGASPDLDVVAAQDDEAAGKDDAAAARHEAAGQHDIGAAAHDVNRSTAKRAPSVDDVLFRGPPPEPGQARTVRLLHTTELDDDRDEREAAATHSDGAGRRSAAWPHDEIARQFPDISGTTSRAAPPGHEPTAAAPEDPHGGSRDDRPESHETASREKGPAATAARAMRASRSVREDSAPDSDLTPAEIQAHLRAGRSARWVANEAGTDVSWVERWLPPIIAERKQVLDEAHGIRLENGDGDRSKHPLDVAVSRRLRERDVDPADATWKVKRRVSGRWSVNVRFEENGRTRSATWSLDRDTGELSASSDLARQLGWTGSPSRNGKTRRRTRKG